MALAAAVVVNIVDIEDVAVADSLEVAADIADVAAGVRRIAVAVAVELVAFGAVAHDENQVVVEELISGSGVPFGGHQTL